jgi:hypothetical protein
VGENAAHGMASIGIGCGHRNISLASMAALRKRPLPFSSSYSVQVLWSKENLTVLLHLRT